MPRQIYDHNAPNYGRVFAKRTSRPRGVTVKSHPRDVYQNALKSTLRTHLNAATLNKFKIINYPFRWSLQWNQRSAIVLSAILVSFRHSTLSIAMLCFSKYWSTLWTKIKYVKVWTLSLTSLSLFE